MLNGGDLPRLRTGNTLEAIARLGQVGCLSDQERSLLEENYGFLRKIEHRLQIMFDLQTHELPEDDDELRKLAAAKLAHEKPGQTLQATALVHEAYLRLVDAEKAKHWNSQAHFFGAAAEAMRRILVDQARKKQSQKRGGAIEREPLEQATIVAAEPSLDVLALNEAMDRFERVDKPASELVKLRYYAGLTTAQAAEALGISPTTADRYWAYARAWLHAEVKKGDSSDIR